MKLTKEMIEKMIAESEALETSKETIRSEVKDTESFYEKYRGNLDALKALAIDTLEVCKRENDAADKKEFEGYLENIVNYHNLQARLEEYKLIKDDPNPMNRAILDFKFSTIRVKETQEKDTKFKLREIANGTTAIDLLDVYKWMKRNKATAQFGADPNWTSYIEHLNTKMAEDKGKKVGATNFVKKIEVSGNVKYSKEAANYSAEEYNLEGLIKMMIGVEVEIPECDKEIWDGCFITDVKNNETHVKFANTRSLAMVAKKICNRILTNRAGYDVKWDMEKKS